MKRLKFLIGSEGKKKGVISLAELRGRDKKLHETLISCGLLGTGPPSKKISFEEALQGAEDAKTKGMGKQHISACWKVAARRALFKVDSELLRMCLKEYEIFAGDRLLEEEDIDRAIRLVQEHYPKVDG